MELKYTPRAIIEIEKESDKPIQDLLADFSLGTIVLFVKKGLGVEDEEAYTAIEEYLKKGNDTFSLYTLIMEKLQDAGFLPRHLDLGKVKKNVNQAIKKGV